MYILTADKIEEYTQKKLDPNSLKKRPTAEAIKKWLDLQDHKANIRLVKAAGISDQELEMSKMSKTDRLKMVAAGKKAEKKESGKKSKKEIIKKRPTKKKEVVVLDYESNSADSEDAAEDDDDDEDEDEEQDDGDIKEVNDSSDDRLQMHTISDNDDNCDPD
ncbi:hypothetical protein HDU79_011898 [Rhizoclosmatium sp. JEL0117]|nr:hypothetical protein HDU79_011898 [Rhizoclosmatium sp. JEL0117]